MRDDPAPIQAQQSAPATAGAADLPRIGPLIRNRRQQNRMTLSALGAGAGLSTGYLSQIERDQATPSLATLAQVARALGVGVEYFIAAPSAQDALSRAGGRPHFSIAGSSVVYERLSTEFPGSQLSSFLMHVPPGYRSETVSHEGEETLYVLEGEIIQWLDREEMRLGAGDALHFRGSRSHAWANRSDRPARLLWTGTLNLFLPSVASRTNSDATAKKPESDPAIPPPVQRSHS